MKKMEHSLKNLSSEGTLSSAAMSRRHEISFNTSLYLMGSPEMEKWMKEGWGGNLSLKECWQLNVSLTHLSVVDCDCSSKKWEILPPDLGGGTFVVTVGSQSTSGFSTQSLLPEFSHDIADVFPLVPS